ncbi:MAG TPA: VOC family protein [Dokdonella sp.]|uniref:VOC family protein n=1 Tax=Dokdonella sp. TaxID=2291710 RepID=UPI002B8D49FA|nr:VOC family protein [Dokdonella sp.]HUD40546.1 VOC family protein [Dokdonella sp.]
MSGPAREGVFVYAKDVERLARFYAALLGLRRVHDAAELAVLGGASIQLIVHAIPPAIAATIRIDSPPKRREDTALKFFFTVPSLAEARRSAAALGGEVLAEVWDGPGFRVCNAVDPEGNVFQLREPMP